MGKAVLVVILVALLFIVSKMSAVPVSAPDPDPLRALINAKFTLNGQNGNLTGIIEFLDDCEDDMDDECDEDEDFEDSCDGEENGDEENASQAPESASQAS